MNSTHTSNSAPLVVIEDKQYEGYDRPYSKELTLCIIYDRENRQVLLGMKQRGLGQGKWNGFGGKLEAGETVEQAAVREVQEECGLTVKEEELVKVAHLTFAFTSSPTVLHTHVFLLPSYSPTLHGIPVPSAEMVPRWFREDKIPYEEMWTDDRYWWPRVFGGEKLRGRFLFEDDQVGVRESEIRVITEEQELY
ncbi:Nudix (Nucleoside diphosphate linked moiety X)-type motif 1 [Saitoella coloradoensis]